MRCRLFIFLLVCLFVSTSAYCGTSTSKNLATWYSTKESKGRMANGQELRDDKKTCATWNYPFGTKLRVSHEGRSTVVEVTDRGPGEPKCPSNKNRKTIDLSKKSFQELAPLSRGVIPVEIKEIK